MKRPAGLSIPRAVDGFFQFKAAEGLSGGTLTNYRQHLDIWQTFMESQQGVTDIARVTTPHLRAFIQYLLQDYRTKPIFGRPQERISPKTVRNWWVTLSALFHWASDEFQIPNPMKGVPAPKFTSPVVEPFRQDEIEALLKACDFCVEAKTNRRRKFTMRRASGYRDRAILLTLLDSGLRAGELCALRIGDLDLKTGKINIRHGYGGGAKGKKGRVVYLGKASRKAVWRYLASREDSQEQDAPLFLGKLGRPMNQCALRQLVHALGDKAGIKKCHPHRFRHTFAITYLRSGGDVFTLQQLLGHSSLDVVQIYARVAEVDLENVHRKASPADNWRL